MNKIIRFLGILLHLIRGFFVFGFARDNRKIIEQGISPNKRNRLKKWQKQLLEQFNVEVIVHGKKFEAPKMIVSNHVSWIDILVLSYLYPGHFIAKSEIQKWPIMGAMITSIGTLFVKRGVRSELKKLSHQISQIIINKSSIIFFPEGKTGNGKQINKIYAGLFESAINAQIDLQPILIIYEDSSGYPSNTVLYIDDITLFSSIMDVFGEKKIKAHIFALEKITTEGRTRKEIASKLETILSTKLKQEIDENNTAV
jgi:1-acyl-sn-glycerol-3-phosphate acyltransferase